MTAKCALAIALLEGRVLNIKNVFTSIGLTNCPREISRMIEKPFGLRVSRVPRTGTNRYGGSISWVDYRLNRIPSNMYGIEELKKYIKKEMEKQPAAKTEKEAKIYKQTQLLLQ